MKALPEALIEASKKDFLDFVKQSNQYIKHHTQDNDWSLRIDSPELRHQRIGGTEYEGKQILLNIFDFYTTPLEALQQVIIHETAHAIVGPGKGHNKEWENVIQKLGGIPETQFTTFKPNYRKLREEYNYFSIEKKEIETANYLAKISTEPLLPYDKKLTLAEGTKIILPNGKYGKVISYSRFNNGTNATIAQSFQNKELLYCLTTEAAYTCYINLLVKETWYNNPNSPKLPKDFFKITAKP
jgi:predicted SprT family Zn-dependent metalloprotease